MNLFIYLLYPEFKTYKAKVVIFSNFLPVGGISFLIVQLFSPLTLFTFNTIYSFCLSIYKQSPAKKTFIVEKTENLALWVENLAIKIITLKLWNTLIYCYFPI